MIRTLDDVEQYTATLARAYPQLAQEIHLKRTGSSEFELARLRRALPKLPASYIDVIRQWDVEAVTIGLFRLAPRRFDTAGELISRLIAANGPSNPIHPILERAGMCEVAAWEADPICARMAGKADAGSLFRLSIDAPDEPRRLASSFEELIVRAAALDSVRATGGGVEGFAQAASLPETGPVREEWLRFAEVALTEP